MSKYYASISENDVVIEIIAPFVEDRPDGPYEWPIEERFPPDFVAALIDVTDLDPRPEQQWTYDGTTFHPPYIPSVDHVINNTADLNGFRAAVVPTVLSAIIEAIDFGDSTDPAVLRVKIWQEYFKALSAVDLTKAEPVWPPLPSA